MQFTAKFARGAQRSLALACRSDSGQLRRHKLVAPAAGAGADDAASQRTRALRSEVDTIVVIYAENRAFDNLYGNFPGARRLERSSRSRRPSAARVSCRRWIATARVLPVLPPTWGGVTAAASSRW